MVKLFIKKLVTTYKVKQFIINKLVTTF